MTGETSPDRCKGVARLLAQLHYLPLSQEVCCLLNHTSTRWCHLRSLQWHFRKPWMLKQGSSRAVFLIMVRLLAIHSMLCLFACGMPISLSLVWMLAFFNYQPIFRPVFCGHVAVKGDHSPGSGYMTLKKKLEVNFSVGTLSSQLRHSQRTKPLLFQNRCDRIVFLSLIRKHTSSQ